MQVFYLYKNLVFLVAATTRETCTRSITSTVSAQREMANPASVDATALLTAMGETMQYEYDVLTRQNQKLHVNNLDIEEQARSDVIKYCALLFHPVPSMLFFQVGWKERGATIPSGRYFQKSRLRHRKAQLG